MTQKSEMVTPCSISSHRHSGSEGECCSHRWRMRESDLRTLQTGVIRCQNGRDKKGRGAKNMDDDAYRERVALVHAWQRHYNMVPRADSRLTDLFARGLVRMNADEVARELIATDFVFQHTLYGEVIEEFLRRVADTLRERHRLSWTATWDIARFYGPIALKLMCVSSSGVTIPDRLP